MKHLSAAALALGIAASGCAPPPPPVHTARAPTPLQPVELVRQQDCAMINAEIARQRGVAAYSGVMATALVEASVRLNVMNVINGLETRAALAGCSS